MLPAELLVVLLNLAILLICYLHVFPRVAGNSLGKLAIASASAICLSLVIVGSKYMGLGYPFLLLGGSLNWFWYTLVTYAVMEIPIAIWYLKRNPS
ncbi:hypothetical protein DFP83_101396 [Idiomarina fontislapidosi]|uniref:Uncharacterized protein n=1 Tax=Idiomarina fontislapidosi TaxID=263723 RepID=A0A432YBL0_9GAMM|nr:hypothetical protein [Idiomarina fontislapidosi]PYE35507.1 hypothetical protein DFP83_101396 [Idiomarina fontislapidosi]RUO58388.1 hypothetical protein CWE25_01995 [Idiomarina fontislapidosi]|tara:strand:+ start:1098 stop:1385 length:288 start_codon:yes stop_codon:yes gene_type:complete